MKYFLRNKPGKIFLVNISVILLLLCRAKIFSQQLSIKVFPADYVYIFEESRKDSVFNLLIHNIGIINNSPKSIKLEKIVINFFNGGTIFQQNNFSLLDILKSNSQLYQLQQNNLLDVYDFMFHTKDLLSSAKLANSGILQKDSALILQKLFFTVGKFPDSLTINVIGESKNKQTITSLKLVTRNYTSANNHILPVAGNWYAAAGPSAHTHHRWGYMEEFAYDLVQMGNNNLTYKDDYTKPENYYCYGKDVLATAAGEVVAVLDGIDDAVIYPKDLSQEEYIKFVRKKQDELMKNHGVIGLSGNSVILKFANNEYAFYAHLKKGSITVKPGEKIVQGQVIGKIGNAGNTTEPHLHFQLNETNDVLNSRSVPIRFTNLIWSESFEPEGSYIKSGDYVCTK